MNVASCIASVNYTFKLYFLKLFLLFFESNFLFLFFRTSILRLVYDCINTGFRRNSSPVPSSSLSYKVLRYLFHKTSNGRKRSSFPVYWENTWNFGVFPLCILSYVSFHYTSWMNWQAVGHLIVLWLRNRPRRQMN